MTYSRSSMRPTVGRFLALLKVGAFTRGKGGCLRRRECLEFDARDELDLGVLFVRDLLWILPLTYFGFYSSGAWVS